MKKICAILLIFSMCISLVGCADKDEDVQENKDGKKTDYMSKEEALVAAEDIVKGMTLEEKVSQMFMVSLDRLSDSDGPVTEFDETLRESLSKYQVGAVVLDSRNAENIGELKELVSSLSGSLKVPAYIATQEGGAYDHSIAASVDEIRGSAYPMPKIMGSWDDKKQIKNVATEIGDELKNLGFNMNIGPNSDLCQDPVAAETDGVEENIDKILGGEPTYFDNASLSKKQRKKVYKKYLSDVVDYKKKKQGLIEKYKVNLYENTCFGNDVDRVEYAVKVMVANTQSKGVSAVMNVFPGICAVAQDHLLVQREIDTSLSKLRKNEFAPYKEGIKKDCDCMMVGHVILKKIDASMPASLSNTIISGIVREELGFDGIVITEDLSAPCITANYSEQESVIRAITAGCDMLYNPPNLGEAIATIRNAIMFNEIEEEVVNQAAIRIISRKLMRGVYKKESKTVSPSAIN